MFTPFWKQQAQLIHCVLSDPVRPEFDPDWLTSTAIALAEGIYQDRAFDRMPILADALICSFRDFLTITRRDQTPAVELRSG